MEASTTDLWEEIRALKIGEQEMLAKIGASYLELEVLTQKQRELQKLIETARNALELTRVSLKTAMNQLVEEAGIEDGEFALDFENKRIVPSNGQTSHSING